MNVMHRFLSHLLFILIISSVALVPTATPILAQDGLSYHLPNGFVRETIAAGLTLPTGFALAPDGRIFITEKAGTVRVVQNGQLLPTPFIDISHKINTVGDRGLLHVAVHPRFPATPYVYLAYVYEPPEAAGHSGSGARVSRVVRVEANRANTNLGIPESETVILGANGTWAHIGNPDQLDAPPYTCYDAGLNPIQDCVPNEGPVHSVGSLGFGPDGALYVASGDGINYGWGSLRAQNPDVLAGKILRINPIDGQGYSNNPFYDGNPNSNRSKIFALGMKNPWRLGFHPQTGELYTTDVGNARWEEINHTPPGANLGWPCYEGPQQNAYDPECQPVLNGEWPVTQAYFAYPHENGRGAVIGGDFLHGDNFPAGYQDDFFYAEFNVATIERLFVDAEGVVKTETFGSGFTGPVQVSSGPDGTLYVLSITEGALFRIVFKGEDNVPPVAVANASPTSGQPPLTVRFSAVESFDTNGDPVQFHWEFGDGETSSDADPSHVYVEPGTYTAELTVTDTSNASSTIPVEISVGNEAPTVQILSPAAGARFHVGDEIEFSGQAIDPEDGELSGNNLHWEGFLHHNDHVHYDAFQGEGTSGSFAYEDHGDNTYVELCLTATDSADLQNQTCLDVRAQEVVYTITSVPDGLSILYEGSPFTTPFKVKTHVNAKRTIGAPAALPDGLRFDSWSDGGTATHEITVGDSDQTLTVRYASPDGDVTETEASEPETDSAIIVNTSEPEPTPATPSSAAISVPANISGAGQILREWWTDIGGNTLGDLQDAPGYPDQPDGREYLTTLETPRTLQADYGSRIRGYIHPPVTGQYRFFITSDDQSGLWLSTDENPANAIYIAGVLEWSGLREWNRHPEQTSGSFELEADRKYYIEVLHKQADFKDNLAVAWQIPGREIEVIDGAFLSPFVP